MSPIVKVLIFNTKGDMLVLFRSGTHPHWPHKIDLPGGDVEEGENEREAQVREIFEETKLQINPDDLVLLLSLDPKKGRRQAVYKVELKIKCPRVEVSWEHEGFEWVSVYDFLKVAISPEDDQVLKTVQRALLEINS